jgi:hypothetical protein
MGSKMLIARTKRTVVFVGRSFKHSLTLFEIMGSLGTLRCNDDPFFCGTILSQLRHKKLPLKVQGSMLKAKILSTFSLKTWALT